MNVHNNLKAIIDSKIVMVALILFQKMDKDTHSLTLTVMEFKTDGMLVLMNLRTLMVFLIKMDAQRF